MNVLFISECSGNALKETRRILDQFAERRGQRTWQTSVTQQGLEAIRLLLRKTARKNTAVACHWIRGIDRTDLLWTVGNPRHFNSRGAIPTNTTSRDLMRCTDENNWHTLQEICLVARLAALLHDLGKACRAFQSRLKTREHLGRNLYRHEWISLRLFESFVNGEDDLSWLARLASATPDDAAEWTNKLIKDGPECISDKPFHNLPGPIAKAVGWLVLTHHRLPISPETVVSNGVFETFPNCITAHWNEICAQSDPSRISPYWEFEHELPVATRRWCERAKRIGSQMQNRLTRLGEIIHNPFAMHVARMCLMLSDHNYSSLMTAEEGRIEGQPGYPVFANTVPSGALNQPLDEHLMGVERFTAQTVYSLPQIADDLPSITRIRALRQRSADPRYQWQDTAYETASSVRATAAIHGAFIVNMASTGTGKTMANAKIMYALSDSESGMRCAFALGLRTLTRQTGAEYRTRLGLTENEVATVAGGGSVNALRDYFAGIAAKRDLQPSTDTVSVGDLTGSESIEDLIPEDEHVVYDESAEIHPSLSRLFKRKGSNERKLLGAPILVCTIDHLMPCTESLRGGHQIAPVLRLLSSDLVLDEIDDYDIDDLPAVGRLMNWAGMLGCRVLISSATLPPALVQGMFESYIAGRKAFEFNRGQIPNEMTSVICLWVDEFGTKSNKCESITDFERWHHVFASERAARLRDARVTRKGRLAQFDSVPKKARQSLASLIATTARELHDLHGDIVPNHDKKVSFGLVRMANIDPLIDVAQHLFEQVHMPDGYVVHLCVYHSQFPALMRSALEELLDRVMNRHLPEAVYDINEVRSQLESSQVQNHIFMVLSSPVSEVGRDHDYDWTIVEPSSMRSIIQIAGRVGRHRQKSCLTPNVVILDRNLKAAETPGAVAYWRPGFECSAYRLSKQTLDVLTTQEELNVITARPRILPRIDLSPRISLVDLEHARLADLFRSQLVDAERPVSTIAKTLGAFSWWSESHATLTGVLQKLQPFRQQTERHVDLFLKPNESCTDFTLHRIEVEGRAKFGVFARETTPVESLLDRIQLRANDSIRPWGQTNYLQALTQLSDDSGEPILDCARKFGSVTLPDDLNGWRFHSALGFGRYKAPSYL